MSKNISSDELRTLLVNRDAKAQFVEMEKRNKFVVFVNFDHNDTNDNEFVDNLVMTIGDYLRTTDE